MTVQEKKYKEIITKVAEEVQLPYNVVDKTYKSFWLAVRYFLSELPLKENLSEEEFKNLRTSVNIPSLGKFSCDYKRYLGVKKRLEYIKHIKENEDSKEN